MGSLSTHKERLATLATHGAEADRLQSGLEPRDDVSHLSADRRAGWRRILSSVATTEGVERTLMDPIREAFASEPEILAFVTTHQQDEHRHHVLLSRYLKNTFDYVKTKRTTSDKIIYDRVFPRLARLFRRKPLYGLSMLHFIENYGVSFYRGFKAQAEADGLHELVRLLKQIEKDELRHMAGLDALIAILEHGAAPLTLTDKLWIRGCLEAMALDINMRPWAVHNREVRDHVLKLDLDPEALTRAARAAVTKTYAEFTGRGGAPC